MGSICDEIVCENCGYEHAYYELYYKTGEEYMFCSKCGWSVHKEMAEGKFKTLGGFGSYFVSFDGSGTTGSFDNIKHLKKFIKDYNKNGKTWKNGYGKKVTAVLITYKEKGKWIRKDLVTGEKMNFDDIEFMEAL